MSSSGNGAKLSTLNVSLNRILGANNDEDITATSPSTKPLQSDPESKTSISPRLIGKRLYIDGYMYGPKRYHSSTIDWDCVLKYSQSCPAKAVTSNNTTNASLVVYEGPESLQHSHPPRIEDVKRAEELVKRKCNQKQLQKPNHVSKASKAACVFRKRPRAEKPALLEDQQMYGLFLRKFLQKPDFDRQNVIEALEVIYSSKQGCLAGVPTVVECRKKIEQDPEILRKNLNTKIAPITIGKRRSTDLQNDTVDLKIIDKVPVEHDNSVVFHSKIMPDMNAADSTLDEETSSLELDNNNCPSSRVESPLPAEISDSEERPTFLGTVKADVIPAVPAAIPINNLSTCTVTQSTSHQGIPVAKAEIPEDDQMEDIYEIKVEPKRVQREPKEPSVTHPNERFTEGSLSGRENPPPLAQNSNLQGDFDPFVHFPREYYQSQFSIPQHHMYSVYNQAIYHPFSYYNTMNPNLNAPSFMNDFQVSWHSNAPSMGYVAAGLRQFYDPMQSHQQFYYQH